MGSRNAKRQDGHSIAGPITLEWLKAAAALPGKSLHTGLALWLLVEIEKSRTITLSNLQASYFSVDRNAKYRALDWLETAGLIEVKRKLGQSPLVTLIEKRSCDDTT